MPKKRQLKRPNGNDKLFKNNVFQLSHGIKKIYQSKFNSYTLEKKFFTVVTFKGLCLVSFQTKWQNLYYTWSVWVFFGFPEKMERMNEDQMNTAYEKWSFFSLCRLVYQSVNLWKIVVENADDWVFACFCGGNNNLGI